MLNGYGETNSIASYGPAVLRIVLAIVFIAHGGQKLFGLWGGPGLEATAGFFGQMGLSPAYPLAVAVGTLEFAGGILLALGAFTLPVSAALAFDMLVAIWKVHLANGFFLNWNLVPVQGHGFEYNLVLIGALVCLMLAGPGALSIDGRRASHARAAAAGRARIRMGKV
jgi:putative oxidoreductase